MGRSGGGGMGGGGHVGGGGFSGGHVSGGGSHHGPSSGRGGRSGMPMGGGRPAGYPMGRRMGAPIFMGGPRMYRRGPMYGGPVMTPGYGAGGCLGCGGTATILSIVSIFLIFAFFALMLNVCSGPVGYETTAPETPASTQERVALDASEAKQTPFYQDADGGWVDNPSQMERGLREFWQKTGVYPFVYIAPNGSLTSSAQCQQLAQEIYPKITDDDAHLVLVFCDDNQGGFVYGYDMGSDAATVMDQQAIDILASYLSRYYDAAQDDEEVFSDAFADTADRIMSVTQPWYVAAAPVIIAVAVVIGIIAIVSAVRTRRRERDAHVREVLNQPLERYGDQDLEDLERKYDTGGAAGGTSTGNAGGSSGDADLDQREADLKARYADLERRERDLRDDQ